MNNWGVQVGKSSTVTRLTVGPLSNFSPLYLGACVRSLGHKRISAKVFSAKIVFSPIHECFLSQKFSAVW